MGQKREDKVLEAINKIMLLSIGFCLVMCLLVNIFPSDILWPFWPGRRICKTRHTRAACG